MVEKDITIQNQVGLHSIPATLFIHKANEFKSSVWIQKDEKRANAKSLLGVLSLGVTGGTQINIFADGPDENEAISALEKLVLSGFAK